MSFNSNPHRLGSFSTQKKATAAGCNAGCFLTNVSLSSNPLVSRRWHKNTQRPYSFAVLISLSSLCSAISSQSQFLQLEKNPELPHIIIMFSHRPIENHPLLKNIHCLAGFQRKKMDVQLRAQGLWTTSVWLLMEGMPWKHKIPQCSYVGWLFFFVGFVFFPSTTIFKICLNRKPSSFHQIPSAWFRLATAWCSQLLPWKLPARHTHRIGVHWAGEASEWCHTTTRDVPGRRESSNQTFMAAAKLNEIVLQWIEGKVASHTTTIQSSTFNLVSVECGLQKVSVFSSFK